MTLQVTFEGFDFDSGTLRELLFLLAIRLYCILAGDIVGGLRCPSLHLPSRSNLPSNIFLDFDGSVETAEPSIWSIHGTAES